MTARNRSSGTGRDRSRLGWAPALVRRALRLLARRPHATTAPNMTAPKRLSSAAILAIAANTMNGPAFTTLPDVAADAGAGLYVALIIASAAMAAFVCRRMVYDMWSSVEGVSADRAAPLRPQYGRGDDRTLAPEDAAAELDAAGREASGVSWLGSGSSAAEFEDDAPRMAEAMTLLGKPEAGGRPLLSRTSIVGHSREAYGDRVGPYVRGAMIASALCLALAQMMLCAAILDGLLVALGGQSCALGWPTAAADAAVIPSWVHCTGQSSMKPYAGSGAPVSLLSMGTAVAAAASVALGTYDLDEMTSAQYVLFGCLVASAVRFCVVLRTMARGLEEGGGETLAEAGGTDGGSPWLIGPHPFQTLGPIMFNFAFVVTSPPSVVLAKTEISAYQALGWACAVMGTMYAAVGLSGAAVATAAREGGHDSNLLSLILLSSGKGGASLLDLCIIGMFGFSALASIPVYCLLAKQKIMELGVAPVTSFFLSNVLPWMIVALTYNAAFFEAFVNWSGLLILGYTNFSLPLLLDLKLTQTRASREPNEQNKVSCGKEARTTAITRGVLIVVTTSITLVIGVSITSL